MRYLFVILLLMGASGAHAASLTDSIAAVRDACRGISDELTDMKKMAGINTAVTGVGTVAGGVALATGLAKANVDKQLAELKQRARDEFMNNEPASEIPQSELDAALAMLSARSDAEDSAPQSDLEQKSKTLGNIRTGTLAVNTATNIAGAAIAGTNRIKGDFQTQIDECIAGVENLKLQLGQARISGDASDAEINRAQQIVTECDMWSTVNLSSINKRATGAAVSSGIGAGMGLIGTITSATANSQKVRDGDDTKEKNLNTAANIMAGGATVASATATIFNATQISAIKRAAEVADKCEGALN